MTFKELVKKTKNINLEELGIYLGKESHKIETISCFYDENSNEYVIKEINDRQTVSEKRGSEEYIVKKMYSIIKIKTPI